MAVVRDNVVARTELILPAADWAEGAQALILDQKDFGLHALETHCDHARNDKSVGLWSDPP